MFFLILKKGMFKLTWNKGTLTVLFPIDGSVLQVKYCLKKKKATSVNTMHFGILECAKFTLNLNFQPAGSDVHLNCAFRIETQLWFTSVYLHLVCWAVPTSATGFGKSTDQETLNYVTTGIMARFSLKPSVNTYIFTVSTDFNSSLFFSRSWLCSAPLFPFRLFYPLPIALLKLFFLFALAFLPAPGICWSLLHSMSCLLWKQLQSNSYKHLLILTLCFGYLAS